MDAAPAGAAEEAALIAGYRDVAKEVAMKGDDAACRAVCVVAAEGLFVAFGNAESTDVTRLLR